MAFLSLALSPCSPWRERHQRCRSMAQHEKCHRYELKRAHGIVAFDGSPLSFEERVRRLASPDHGSQVERQIYLGTQKGSTFA